MRFDNDGFPKMRGDWLFKVVPVFIGLVFLLIVGYWIFIGVVAKKAVSALGDCGVPAFVVHKDANGDQTYTVKCPETQK
jgi:hypothetical protein